MQRQICELVSKDTTADRLREALVPRFFTKHWSEDAKLSPKDVTAIDEEVSERKRRDGKFRSTTDATQEFDKSQRTLLAELLEKNIANVLDRHGLHIRAKKCLTDVQSERQKVEQEWILEQLPSVGHLIIGNTLAGLEEDITKIVDISEPPGNASTQGHTSATHPSVRHVSEQPDHTQRPSPTGHSHHHAELRRSDRSQSLPHSRPGQSSIQPIATPGPAEDVSHSTGLVPDTSASRTPAIHHPRSHSRSAQSSDHPLPTQGAAVHVPQPTASLSGASTAHTHEKESSHQHPRPAQSVNPPLSTLGPAMLDDQATGDTSTLHHHAEHPSQGYVPRPVNWLGTGGFPTRAGSGTREVPQQELYPRPPGHEISSQMSEPRNTQPGIAASPESHRGVTPMTSAVGRFPSAPSRLPTRARKGRQARANQGSSSQPAHQGGVRSSREVPAKVTKRGPQAKPKK